MTRRISICVFAMLFAALFFACGGDGDDEEKNRSSETPLPPGWDSAAGFFQHGGHKYGFDRHTNDRSGDSVAYISVLAGDSAVVMVKKNKEAGDYFICRPNSSSIDSIGSIGSSGEHRHAVYTSAADAGGSLAIALCRKVDGDEIEIVQELHVRPYEWKPYSFDVYILGDPASLEDRHQLLNRDSAVFWNRFDSVFKQAVVKKGSVHKEFVPIPASRNYILTWGEGDKYENDFIGICGSDTISDIGRVISGIQAKAQNGGRRMAIIQIGYKTKRFWPLEANEEGNIQICGYEDNLQKLGLSLELEPKPNRGIDCPPFAKASVSKDTVAGVWKLNGSVTADASNANPDCVVFAADSLDYYVGEVKDASAIMWPIRGSPNVSVAIAPWLGDWAKNVNVSEADFTARVALHELGHAMGLVDINGNVVSDSTISEENNLMGYALNGHAEIGYKLRKRGIAPLNTNPNYRACVDYYKKDESKCIEYQWDCLHSNGDFCVAPYLYPYYFSN